MPPACHASWSAAPHAPLSIARVVCTVDGANSLMDDSSVPNDAVVVAVLEPLVVVCTPDGAIDVVAVAVLAPGDAIIAVVTCVLRESGLLVIQGAMKLVPVLTCTSKPLIENPQPFDSCESLLEEPQLDASSDCSSLLSGILGLISGKRRPGSSKGFFEVDEMNVDVVSMNASDALLVDVVVPETTLAGFALSERPAKCETRNPEEASEVPLCLRVILPYLRAVAPEQMPNKRRLEANAKQLMRINMEYGLPSAHLCVRWS